MLKLTISTGIIYSNRFSPHNIALNVFTAKSTRARWPRNQHSLAAHFNRHLIAVQTNSDISSSHTKKANVRLSTRAGNHIFSSSALLSAGNREPVIRPGTATGYCTSSDSCSEVQGAASIERFTIPHFRSRPSAKQWWGVYQTLLMIGGSKK